MIVLATLNARYIHASVGLRYLYANLAELQPQTSVLEFEVSQPAREVVEALLKNNPRIVGFGVYIWNVERTTEVISLIKKVRPEVTIIIGGPEVSFEYEGQRIVELADYLITGEADVAFPELCRKLMGGDHPSEKVIAAKLPELAAIELPYRYYSDEDIRNRVIYVEASRGCPFTCEFCLSSIDIPVRQFDHQQVLQELDDLYRRGARTFKFVDRTFNLNMRTSASILEFFLERMTPGLFVHFEMVPDRFPDQLRELVSRFPPGALQLEIGVQSLNPETGKLISRRQDVAKLIDNLHFLRSKTSAHLHVDLIVGLPGEGIESFASGFDRLVACNPQEIQVGILKKLRGTPIVRHVETFDMRFSDYPPYEVLSTRDIPFTDVQRMGRFARYWDLVANSGNFVETRPVLLSTTDSAFSSFLTFSDWLFGETGKRASISLKNLTELLFTYLTESAGLNRQYIGELLARDYLRGGRSDLPAALREFRAGDAGAVRDLSLVLKRQRRAVAAE
jgi:radical SAM superfamily enzyme YgiQ (UPF0313 family)